MAVKTVFFVTLFPFSMSAASPSSAQFMLLLRQPHGDGPPPSGADLEGIMVHFRKWMADMEAGGHVLGTNGLAPAGKVLRRARGSMTTDGPLMEAKEIVGGYVLIEARDLEEAVELASACPGLNYAMAVEVRPVMAPCCAEP
jgi:hypothetical protein